MPRHVFGKDLAELNALKSERKASRAARIVVCTVHVNCPYCWTRTSVGDVDDGYGDDGEMEHSEAVFAPAGRRKCANCLEMFTIPDLSTVFREIRPIGK